MIHLAVINLFEYDPDDEDNTIDEDIVFRCQDPETGEIIAMAFDDLDQAIARRLENCTQAPKDKRENKIT